MSVFLKSPERISKIVEDISLHYNQKVKPHGLKAMIVTPDRFACTLYKEEMDKYFPSDTSRVVISANHNDELDFKQKWDMSKDEQERVVDAFNDENSNLNSLLLPQSC